MKNFLLFIAISLTTHITKAQTVVLDPNGITVKWTGTTVPNPYFILANPRGPLEWFAIIDNSTKDKIHTIRQIGQPMPIPYDNIVTTLVTDMHEMFLNAYFFNQPIGSWDVSNVTNMYHMFGGQTFFNQSIGSWDVGNVTNMGYMFAGAYAFNRPIANWNVSKVTDMSYMFKGAISFDQPIGSWNVSKVTNMSNMFSDYPNVCPFNQPIGSWDVSSVTNMSEMFMFSKTFNQPIDSWNVSKVTDMHYMFAVTDTFDQPIGSWDVSSVNNMSGMFNSSKTFNQPIGSWNVGKVTDMSFMFNGVGTFNQPIGSWNVSNVTNMNGMFQSATSFNQSIGSWDVGKVNNMQGMFFGASAFNQPLGSWNVGKVTNMQAMFSEKLSTTNYDNLLIGWASRGTNGGKLNSKVFFYGGNSNYCNSSDARNFLINTYGWTITDGGLNCAGLSTEDFDRSNITLYPNPTLGLLNIKVDSGIANKPYSITDTLGKIVLKGKLNESDTTINVEHLSNGIYYIKVANDKASKFIKE